MVSQFDFKGGDPDRNLGEKGERNGEGWREAERPHA